MTTLYKIPLEGVNAWFTQRVTLDDNDYVLSFIWTERESRWIFSVLDSQGGDIVRGIPLNESVDLLHRFKDARLPEGMLFLYDGEHLHCECTKEGLGDRWTLYYGVDDE